MGRYDEYKTDDFSPVLYILRWVLVFGLVYGCMWGKKIVEKRSQLSPEASRAAFFDESQRFGVAIQKMKNRGFNFEEYKKTHSFLKKFAGFFDLESVCENYAEPCLWNSLTYKTLDGQVTPAYTGVPNVGQFRTKSGALYLLYSYEDNNLWIFVDINGINGKPNRFGIDVFVYYLDSATARLKYMGAAGTPYQNMNLYCNPYSSNKYNGLSCPFKAVLDKDYFVDTFKVVR